MNWNQAIKQFGEGFRSGTKKGRTTWLQVADGLCGGIFGVAGAQCWIAAWRGMLNRSAAASSVGAVAFGLLVLTSLLIVTLKRSAEERAKAVIPAAVCCVVALSVLWLCLGKLV